MKRKSEFIHDFYEIALEIVNSHLSSKKLPIDFTDEREKEFIEKWAPKDDLEDYK